MPTPDFSKVWASNSPLPEYTFSDADYLTGWDFVGSAPPTKNEFDAWFKLVDTKLNWLYGQLQDTASKLYPVGSVYISFNATDPSTLFGGTWVRLKDTFLLANGDSYAPNTSGGSATKNITVDNLPSHSHTISWDGNHSHTRGSMNITGTISASVETYVGAITGAFYQIPNYATVGAHDYVVSGIGFDASRAWGGETSLNGYHSHAIGNTGSSLPLNIMPPYRTVYMWRRTA
jgi:microcystin-dependent protein